MFSEDEEIIAGLQISAPTPESILLQGLLKKKSPKGFLKAWQDRLIVLTRDGLFYYKAKELKEIKNLQHYQGAVPLRAVASIALTTKKGFRFDIHLEEQYGRVFSFTAKTEQEVQNWHTQILIALKDLKDSDAAAGVVAPAAGAAPAGAGGGKIWRNPNAQVKTKGGGVKTQEVVYRQLYSPEMMFLIQSYKPTYKLLNNVMKPTVPQDPTISQSEYSLQQVLSSLFTEFKVERIESDTEHFGSVYIVGNSHYNLTHRSYLLHCVKNEHAGLEAAVQCMQTLKNLRFPLFPTQIHCGATLDTVYSIYHPPLRFQTDSLFCWLQMVKVFPEHVVQWILIHLIITIQLLHLQGILFTSLSPEFTFFDREGIFRICDLFLSPDLSVSSVSNDIPEYKPPEVVAALLRSQENIEKNPHSLEQIYTPAGDFWRLGVFLYELATGNPPFRAPDVPGDEYSLRVYSLISEYRPEQLHFPPEMSPVLRDLITRLLQVNPAQRLSSIDALLEHPFLAGVDPQLYDITYLLTQAPKPQWILENIVARLDRDPTTPSNLTFLPDQPLVHRLRAHLVAARYLTNVEQFSKLLCSVSLEPDIFKTRVIDLNQRSTRDSHAIDLSEAPHVLQKSTLFGSPSLNPQLKAVPRSKDDSLSLTTNIQIDENFTFDFVHPVNTSHWPDLTIEVYVQKRDGIKDMLTTSTDPNKSMLYAIITIPISHIRNGDAITGIPHFIDGWYTMYSVANNEPCGQLRFQLEWESQFIELESALATSLHTDKKQFAVCFGKMVPVANKKLWSTIIDQSVSPYEQSSTSSTANTNSITIATKQDSYHGHGTSPTQQHIALNLAAGNNTSYSSQYQVYQPPSQNNPSSPSQVSHHLNSPVPPQVPPPLPPSELESPISPPLFTRGPPAFNPPPPAPTLDPETVPTNWKQTIDTSSGNLYYYNSVTKATSWTKPPCLQ